MNNTISYTAILISLFLLRSFIGFSDDHTIGKTACGKQENKEFIERSKVKTKKAHLIVLDSVYQSFNGLTVVCNGLLECTGDMQPRVKVGLIRRNNMGQWDTIVDLGSVGVLPFGPVKFKWNNDTLKILPPVQFYPTSIDQVHYSGVYKLTFVSYHFGKPQKQSSNEFKIEPYGVTTSFDKQLKGFSDTTVVHSYHFSEIQFYHYRVFTGAAESMYHVWHKIRIYAPHAISPFLFEKSFTYAMYPNAKSNNFFEAMDYNLDANIDFRIKCYDGSFDYYLWDYAQKTYVYSEVFSNAYSFSIDNEVNTLTANFSRYVPLEGTYDLEGVFSLPDMRLFYLKRRILTVNGLTLEPVDLSMLSYQLKLTIADLPQPEIHTISSWQYPDVASTKRHYFPTDSVYIITNELGNLYDRAKLDFVLELFNQISSEWQLVSPTVSFNEREMVKIDNGYKMKIGSVDRAAKSELVGSTTLIPGRYRITVRFDKKVVNQTPDFYVH